jgi:hemolysin III
MKEAYIMNEKFRDPVSGLTHLGAAIVSAVGLVILMILSWGDPQKQLFLAIYGISLILMFSASATYHLVRATPEKQLRLRKWDHSAIYLLIAGTYTPICLTYFTGMYRWGILAAVWAFALIGIAVKIYVIHAPRLLNASIYLIMGWLAIFASQQIITNMPLGAIIWLFAGGLFFTVGAVIYVTKKMDFVPGIFGFHEVWHIFVILGCLCHLIMVAGFIAPAVPLA